MTIQNLCYINYGSRNIFKKNDVSCVVDLKQDCNTVCLCAWDKE